MPPRTPRSPGTSLLWVCALSLVAAASAQAQVRDLPLAHWQHTKWVGTSGPPVSGIYVIIRSPDGYLWLAGYNALIRFDGVRFTVFDSSTTPVLRSKELGTYEPLYVDRSGAMWISGPGNEKITYRDGEFRFVFHHLGLLSGEDEQGLIWMSQGKPYRYAQGKLVPVPLPASLAKVRILLVAVDGDRGWYLGSRTDGLWYLSSAGQARLLAPGDAVPLLVTRDGAVWVRGTGVHGVARFFEGHWETLHLPDGSEMTGRVAREDSAGAVWILTTNQGLVRYRDGKVELYAARDGLSDNRGRGLELDSDGVAWVSTDAGIDRLRPAEFTVLDPTQRVPQVSESFALDRSGGIWGASRDARSILFLNHGVISNDGQPLGYKKFQFGDREHRVLATATDSGAWAKVAPYDLMHLHASGRHQTFGLRDGLPAASAVGGLATRDGALWIEFFPQGFGRLRNGRYASTLLPELDTASIAAYGEDGAGRVWVSYGDEGKAVVFAGDSVVATVTLPVPHLDLFALEHGDTLWGVSEYGLVRLIDTVAVKVGVAGLQRLYTPRTAVGVARGSLWIASAAGIARAPLADVHRRADGGSGPVNVHLFDQLDGLSSTRTSSAAWRSVQTDADDRLWIGTASDLAVAGDPSAPWLRKAPTVLIEEITVDGTPLGEGESPAARPGLLTIHFTVNGLDLSERARLQYRLEGVDRGWTDASAERVVGYHNVRPGDYTFAVRVMDEQGRPHVSLAERHFRIPPAWNQGWLFFALLALAVAALAGSVTVLWQRRRYRFAAQQAQSRFDAILAERRALYEATLTERSRIAQELHDTLLQGFAGVSMQLKAAERSLTNDPGAAAETLARVQHLTRDTLREARERVLDLNEPDLGTEDLVGALETNALALTATTGIGFSLTTDGERRRLPRTVELAALRIGREAIANAVRHAAASQIACVVQFESTLLRLEIRDNGRGFTAEQGEQARQQGHLGLSGMRNRAAQAGGSCEIRSTPATGTIVVIQLPLTESR